MAELAGGTAAFFSNLSSLAVMSAIWGAGAVAAAALFSNASSLATTPANSEAGVAGTAAFCSNLSSLAAISALAEELLLDALAELIETRSVVMLDLIQPDRHLRERGVELAHLGALLLALL